MAATVALAKEEYYVPDVDLSNSGLDGWRMEKDFHAIPTHNILRRVTGRPVIKFILNSSGLIK